MLIPFEELPPNARVWIYQASRDLTENECAFIEEQTELFINNWEAHGASLQASFGILYNRFLVIAVNQAFNLPSGCSIDKSVALVQAIEKELDVAFFDRTQIAFLIDGKVHTFPLSQLKSLVAEGVLTTDSVIFDNTADTKETLENSWKKNVLASWASRYFPKSHQKVD